MGMTLDEILAGAERTPGKCDGLTIVREYVLADGRPLKTIELPAPILNGLGGPKEFAWRAAMWERGQQRQILQLKIRDAILAGGKNMTIAADLGSSATAVQNVRSKMRRELSKAKRPWGGL